MKESLTISQMIAETKRLAKVLREARNEIDFVRFYRKDKPFIDGRTVKEYTDKMTADLQSYIDNQKRLFAIKSALSKANRETTLTVPAQPLLAAFVSPMYNETKTEEITIAEAINRKMFFKNVLVAEAQSLMEKFSYDMSNKARIDIEVDQYISQILEKKFPSDAKQAWSTEKYNEEKKKETENAQVIRIDPANLVDTNAIAKYSNAIAKYLSDIDTLLSQVNASTVVEVEY